MLQLLIVIAIAGTILGLMLPSVRPTSHPGLLACQARLTKISEAVLAYCQEHGRFPEASVVDGAGRPMHSWRVLLLPYLGKQTLHDAYDFQWPWNSPNNAKLAAEISEIFQCPSCHGSSPDSNHTNYLAVTGQQSIWGKPYSEINRDLSEVVMLVETTECDTNVLEPKDLTNHQFDMDSSVNDTKHLSSNHAGGILVAFADGHVKFIDTRGLAAVLSQVTRPQD